MYRELNQFVKHMVRQPAVYRDGELWTAFVVGVAAVAFLDWRPDYITAIKKHFPEFLTVTSIIFGFVLATLTSYLSVTTSWSDEKKVRAVAEKLIDWHVWTLLWVLALLGYTVALWSFDLQLPVTGWAKPICYGLLVFLGTYVACQIINHALTLRWVSRQALRLSDGAPPSPTPHTTKRP